MLNFKFTQLNKIQRILISPLAKLFNRVKISNYSKGVTLIELVVVLAVTTIVMGAGVDIFTSLVRQQRSILGQQEFLSDAKYATEYVSKSIRDAVKDKAGNCLPESGDIYLLTHYDLASGFYNGIKFVTKDNICQEFFQDTDGILREVKNGGGSQNIVLGKFKLTYARFIINGDKSLSLASEGDLVQPRITMSLDVQIQAGTGQQEKIIQTTVSQLNLNK